MKKLAIIACAALLGVACSAPAEVASVDAASPSAEPRIKLGAEGCAPGWQDEGRSIKIEAGPGGKHDFEDVKCVLDGLDAPAHVWSRIEMTRALDGTQEEEWDGLRATWTYRASKGLSILIVDTEMS